MAAKEPKGKANTKPVTPKPPAEKLPFPQHEGLSEIRNRFAFWYAVLGCGSHAAVKAGYSKRSAKESAYRLLRDPHVQDAIRIETKRHCDSLGITEDLIRVRLLALADQTATEGDTYSPATSLRSLELLGKNIGMFRDQVDHTIGLRLSHEEALAELGD